MTEQHLISYDRFVDVIKLANFGSPGDWDEESFEDIYSDFCKEVYNKDWVDILEEDYNYCVGILKQCFQLAASFFSDMGELGFDKALEKYNSDEYSEVSNFLEISIDDTENVLQKFLIWLKQLMERLKQYV